MHHKAQTEEAIHREITYILQRYIADPRLQKISVTAVRLSKKLDYADIKVTQLDPHCTKTETIASLTKASSKIRYYLAKQRLHARKAPKLRFHYDTLLIKNTQLHQLINRIVD